MKTMKTSMKCFIAMFVMAMAIAVTGFTSNAASPTVVTDCGNVPQGQTYTVQFAAGQQQAPSVTFSIPGKGTAIVATMANTDVSMSFNGVNFYAYDDQQLRQREITFSQGGNYTLTMSRSSYDATYSGTLVYAIYFFNDGASSINANQSTTYTTQNYNTYNYTKITVKKSGYIKVDTPSWDNYSVYVTLLNNKKKPVSSEIYTSNSYGSTTYFGVKKGTYYIRTKSSDIYSVKYTFKKVSQSKKGSKQSNAVEIKAGKKVTGVFPATGKAQTHWYKVRLTKKKVFKLSVKTLNSDRIKIQIIPANKRFIIIGDTVRLSPSTKAQPVKSKGSWNAGVYYIKVTNNTKLDSGYYQITFKK